MLYFALVIVNAYEYNYLVRIFTYSIYNIVNDVRSEHVAIVLVLVWYL